MEAGLLFAEVFIFTWNWHWQKKKSYKVLPWVVRNIKSEHGLNVVLNKRLSQWPNADGFSEGSRWIQQVFILLERQEQAEGSSILIRHLSAPRRKNSLGILTTVAEFCQINHIQTRVRTVYNLEASKSVLISHGWTSVF